MTTGRPMQSCFPTGAGAQIASHGAHHHINILSSSRQECQTEHHRRHTLVMKASNRADNAVFSCPRKPASTLSCNMMVGRVLHGTRSGWATLNASSHHQVSSLSHTQQPQHAHRLRERGAMQQVQVTAHTNQPSHVEASTSDMQQPALTSPSPSPSQQQHWFDSLSQTQRYVLADEWGFSLVGSSLPAGVPMAGLMTALPEAVNETDLFRALSGLVAPLALMTAGYAWLWYMHSITPWWQLLGCWLAIGTAYTGLFQIAHECARGTFLPEYPSTQALLGSLLMAPSLFSLDAWRVRIFNHGFMVNQLGGDSTAWHPVTVSDVRKAGPVRRAWLRLVTATPLKLLSSLGGWVQALQCWDLFTYYYELRRGVLLSWAAPAAWVGLVLPTLMTCAGGLSGLFTYWLAPLLFFHLWLSTLTMVQHTAPHIPWRPPATHDLARSVVSGTVTIPMPGWLEVLLNHANYNLPQHVMFDGVPQYHAKAATQALREKLWPYMQEAPFSIKLITNHITKWQIYDEEDERYITFDEALQRIQAEEGASQATGQTDEPDNGNGPAAALAT